MPTHHVFSSILLLILLQLLLTDFLNAKPTKVNKDVAEDIKSLIAQLNVPKNNAGLQPITVKKSEIKNGARRPRRTKKRSAAKKSVELQSKVSNISAVKNSLELEPSTNISTVENGVTLQRKTSKRSGVENEVEEEEKASKRSKILVQYSPPIDSKTMKARGDGDGASDSSQSVTGRLSNAISSVVNPIDEYARKAVNGVGLVMGVVNGIASGIGTQAYNSLVRVHNTNVDNLTKIRDLTKNVGHSVVDLGSTMAEETVNVLDAVRRENNRLLRKATENVPIVRHLVSLKDVAGLAATNSISSVVKGSKRLGNLAINAMNMRKGDEIEESKGGFVGLVSGVSGMSGASADSLINTFGNTKGMADMAHGLITDNEHEGAFEIGNFIGSTAGAAKLAKIVATGDIKPMFSK